MARPRRGSRGKRMQRQSYRGHTIAIQMIDDRPQLFIDGEHVVTVRDRSGVYIAAGMAFAPESSLLELGKKLVDYRNAVLRKKKHGRA